MLESSKITSEGVFAPTPFAGIDGFFSIVGRGAAAGAVINMSESTSSGIDAPVAGAA